MGRKIAKSSASRAGSGGKQANAAGPLDDLIASVRGRPGGVSSGEALYRRIYGWFRTAILAGVLPGGSRLPPGRLLAEQLGVSRNTVSGAFDQLLAEGYIEGRPGSGTFVSELPAGGWSGPANAKTKATGASGARASVVLSERGRALANLPVTRSRHPGVAGEPDAAGAPLPFAPGVPGLDRFPGDEFARLSAKVYRQLQLSPASLGYTAPAGVLELREAIAAHLRIDRGVCCEADQIVVVHGSQAGLDLCARMLLDPGDTAFVEDPGYLGARAAFTAAGARIVGIPVTPAGGLALDVLTAKMRAEQNGRKKKPGLSKMKGASTRAGESKSRSLLYVTPSHQFPLGMTMSLSRRLELLEFARENRLLILEDDYDSEYRYDGRPIAALQGLDEAGETVVYLGTFSKVLAPGLRLGYLVLPRGLVEAFVTARALVDRQPPAIAQLTVARYMLDGGFYRHLRRMRELYRERRATLLRGIAQLPGAKLTPLPSDTGLHVTAVWESSGKNDRALSARAAKLGVDLPALGNYYLRPDAAERLQGLLFGFAAYDEPVMRQAFRRIAPLFAKPG